MTSDRLTATLAERVMRWGVAPHRFLTGNRGWIPRWRFQPMKNIEDAFQLLDEIDPDECRMSKCRDADWTIRITTRGTVGCAQDASIARAITLAVARAIDLDVSECE
jgi:hypothetical protein